MPTASRHFVKTSTIRAGVVALICLIPTTVVASESCLTADIALKNWKEVDVTSITDAGAMARCWQSASNARLEMCLVRKGEPATCRLQIGFQGKSEDFAVDETYDLTMTEKVLREQTSGTGMSGSACTVVRTLIETKVAISTDERIRISEDSRVSEDEICINGIGEILGYIEQFSLLLGDYLAQVTYTKLDLNYRPDELAPEPKNSGDK